MPTDIDYIYQLTGGNIRVRARFERGGLYVISFLVQLETFHQHVWKPVQRYDDSHGKPHRDYLDQRGREYRKDWLDVDRNTALTLALQDFKINGRRYVAEFLEGEFNDEDS